MRRVRVRSAFILLVVATSLQWGCGGSPASTGLGGGSPVISSVAVSGPANVQVPYCNPFAATVSGTGNYDHSVQWYVDEIAGGNAAIGTIDSTGRFCSPAQPPATNPVSIKAVANGDATKSGTATVRVIEVTISPSDVHMYLGDSQQFTASVTGAVDNIIHWEVNGIVGGNSSVGTISPTGLYAAPAQYPNLAIQVDASSTDQSIAAVASINLSGKIQISPVNPQVVYGNKQQFTATVIGAPNEQVNWIAQYGAVTSSGLYTASGTFSPDIITAWTSYARGTVPVQVLSLKPNIASFSPKPAGVFDTLSITGTNLSNALTAVFQDAMGGHIFVKSTNATGTSATFTVPQGAVSGNFYVMSQQGSLSPGESNTVQFQRLARLRIHAPVRDLAAGESTILQYALMGDPSLRTVSFSADLGTLSGATYTAPSSVMADTFAHVTGCISGTHSCNSLILALHPFRVAPDVPLVAAGQSLQLSAELGGGTTTATWDLLAGGGSLNSNGLYTAGTALQDGGPALVSAISNSQTETTSVGVTGKFPGLVNRLYEYADQHNPDFQGIYPYGMAVIGNRLYILAGNHIGSYTDSYYWFDVYDIADPLHPVWLSAAESNSSGPIFASGKYLYSYAGDLEVPPGSLGGVMLYSVQSGVPVLVGHLGRDQTWSISSNQGVVSAISYNSQGKLEVFLDDVTSGTIVAQDLIAPLPPDANYFIPDASIVSGNHLYVSVQKNDNSGGYLLTYDLTTSPPTLLGTVDGRSLAFYTSGNLLFTAASGMEVYDISSGIPQFLSYIEGINAANLSGNRLLAYTVQQGCLLLDLSHPQNPQITSTFFDGVITQCGWPAFVGNYVYISEYGGGVGIYDASKLGGPVVKTILYGGGASWSDAYDLLLASPYLYGAASSGFGATLSVYDTSTNPASRVGGYLDPSQQGFAVQSSGNYLYFGGSANTTVLDISQPSSPAFVSSVGVPAISLARSNNTLFAGTSNNQLVTLDLTNPAHPTPVNTILLPDLPLRMRVAGKLLLVADDVAGLLIYDITTPHSPVLRSQFKGLALAADVAVVGTTAYVAADTDGLAILNISNPGSPALVSKTSLSRIDPFSSDNPLNEALSITANNGLIYVGTINDNGIVFALDCTNLASPRIVSMYAYGDFVETWVGAMVFNGSDLFVGGSLGFTYPVTQASTSQPFNSINQYFPPLPLQSILPLSTAQKLVGNLRVGSHSHDGRFPKSVAPSDSLGAPSVSRFSRRRDTSRLVQR